MKLYAIRVFVQNWEEACAFYRDKLNLPERFRDDQAGWAEYDIGGPCIGVQYVDDSDAEGQQLAGRFLGVSLQVDDIEATYQKLKANGVAFISPPEKQDWGGTLASFKDPEGNVFTLLG